MSAFSKINLSRLSALSIIFFTYSCRQPVSQFESLPSENTHITFTNKLEKKKNLNILYYLYYYNGAGVATGDINNDGLIDIYFAANSKGNNKLYLNNGDFTFSDITITAGVKGTADWCTGVTMADINADGYLDIYVSAVSNRYGFSGHNELFINNKDNTFTEKSEQFGLNTSCFTTQSVFFDYDRDGDLDCYMLNQSHHPHENIVDAANRLKYDSLAGDKLFRNDLSETGKFSDVSRQAGIYQSSLGYGLGIAVADLNNDGWDDIYIGNDFHENDYYYINNGNGSFSEKGANHFRHYSRFSMGNDIADYNNDGQLDLITVDMLPGDEKILKTYGSDESPDTYKMKLESHGYQHQYSKNCLQKNNGNGVSFSEIGLQSGVSATDWSWCPLFADFDNDGNKDLFITSGIVKRPVDLDFIRFLDKQTRKGINQTDQLDDETVAAMPDGSSHPFIFKGDGIMNFSDMSNEWGTAKLKGYSNGAAYADFDNDGDLDVVINCINSTALILKNKTSHKNFITLSFKDSSENKNGIGSKAYLFAGNKMQYLQLMPARGFMSSSTMQLHFGLDTLTKVDSILIIWPNQDYQVLKNPVINKNLVVEKTDVRNNFNYTEFSFGNKELLKDITNEINLNWKHNENNFLDYNIQYLIPHGLSTRGPRIAVSDVNKDGLDDFYVCGAKMQPGALMIQQKDGSFKSSDTSFFREYAVSEDVDAAFFDAEGDGDSDLLVVAGGNEVPANELALLDRLYLNDGSGHFTIAKKPFSFQFENKSCVVTGDVDNDGDIDFFIGNSTSPTIYGTPSTSYLYLNEGNGKFTKAGDNIIPLYQLGMVTAAAFADIDGDGWKEIIVAGEWMPVKIFKNKKGKFTPNDIPATTGLWQSLFITDINNDGHADILAGNWGWNNKFYAGKNGPLKLYIKDFDFNGKTEQLLCYTINEKEYPFLAKDELEKSLPVLKKYYLKYSEVAGKTVQYIFFDLFKDYSVLKAEVLSSSCFINDGKGNFSMKALPPQLQMAPIFSFSSYEDLFFACGNFFNVIPFEGRYDAQQPTFFSYNKIADSFQYHSLLSDFNGEARDAKWINSAGGDKNLVIARNNQPLVFYFLKFSVFKMNDLVLLPLRVLNQYAV